MARLSVRAAWPCLVLLATTAAACGDRGAPRNAPAQEATEAGADVAVPEGAEAVSLLGRPLHAPVLPAEIRRDREARLAEARAQLDADPEDADALIWMGRRLAYLGRYRDALDVYTRGVGLHPEDPRLLRHRGHRFLTLRRFDDAIADLRKAADLVQGEEDEIEPDGLPNARGIPTSTLQFNIWYHLGLAHFLKGELEQAALAFNEARQVSKHPDSAVAATYWLVNVFRRLGLEARATEALAEVHAGADIIESGSYLDVLLLHKGEKSPEELGGGAGEATLQSTTTAYGLGNWHFVEGRREEAFRTWERTVAAPDQWAAFGFIAAEAELARAQGRRN